MDIEKIRNLNDQLRKTFTGGKVFITQGVRYLDVTDQIVLINKIKTFDSFNYSNDPHNEHDFGAVNLKGEDYFWKIDYYDADYLHFSPCPSDEAVTNRVLTILRAEEY